MKVYLAGKISGDPNYRDKFRKAAEQLGEDGNIILNPAILPEGMAPEDYMSICLPMLFAADVVAFLPDSHLSAGARIEYNLAIYINKHIVMLQEEAEK